MTTNPGHEAVEPTEANSNAEWWCTECDQPCRSDNPCDHCSDGWYAWLDGVDE